MGNSERMTVHYMLPSPPPESGFDSPFVEGFLSIPASDPTTVREMAMEVLRERFGEVERAVFVFRIQPTAVLESPCPSSIGPP